MRLEKFSKDYFDSIRIQKTSKVITSLTQLHLLEKIRKIIPKNQDQVQFQN